MSELRLDAPTAGRLDAVLAEAVPDLSRSRVAALVKDGAVRVAGVVVTRPSHKVAEGDSLVLVVPEPAPDRAIPQDLPVVIVYEDDDLVVVDKAPGMVVHPSPGHADGTLVNALLHHVDGLSGVGGVQRPGIVHRLDRGTSGLMVVAKHDRSHGHLAAQFADHSAGRVYLALCLGAPDGEGGTLRSDLARHPTDRLRWASTERGGKPAITHWRRLARGRGLSLVACRLETGRTHQVRVHLTEQGWPLAGDPTYRRRSRTTPAWLAPLLPEDRPMLHAWRLGLTHPSDGRRLVLEAAPPPDFAAVAEAAGIRLEGLKDALGAWLGDR